MISIQLSEHVSQLLEAPLNPHTPSISSQLKSYCIPHTFVHTACVCEHAVSGCVKLHGPEERAPCALM